MTRFLVVVALWFGWFGLANAAEPDGFVVVRATDEEVAGAQPLEFQLWDTKGAALHSGTGSGAWSAGKPVPVAPGTWYVQFGQNRAGSLVQRVEVQAGRATVVPTGWVEARTTPAASQPKRGCNPWTAELTVFVERDGQEVLFATNRDARPGHVGRLQLPVGEFIVYFNDFPVRVQIRADEVYRIPLGFQGPVAGDKPQISMSRDESTRAGARRYLCEDGPMHLPAGRYWASAMVTTAVHPFSERMFAEVEVSPEGEHGYAPIATKRVEPPLATADRPLVTPTDSADEELVRRIRGGGESGGGRLKGFGR